MTVQPTGSGKLPVAVLDANVLYSRVLSDYFVHARSQNVITLRWSSAIIEEMITSRKKRVSERFTNPAELEPRLAAVDGQRTYIGRMYPCEFVEPSAEDFTPFQHLAMPDPDDRHVVATAVVARADYLCTNNIADFPDAVMAELGIRRVTPEALLNPPAVAERDRAQTSLLSLSNKQLRPREIAARPMVSFRGWHQPDQQRGVDAQ